MIWTFLIELGVHFLRIFALSAPYLLLGLLAAGVLRVYIPDEWLLRVLGSNRRRAVVLASLMGVPLPICSCGIVPVSMALRRKGVGRGATMSFLIATPETGVPSIALTLGLLGPVMAIVRPVVALITSVVAGLLVDTADDLEGDVAGEEDLGKDADEAHSVSGDDEAESACTCGEVQETAPSTPPQSAVDKLRETLRYGFAELLSEIATWLLIGLALTALIAAILPDGFLQQTSFGSGLLSMLLAILVGIPLYMCASGSTPLAAAFVAKGLNPGAALVFLITGPATNMATITLVRRFYGRRFTRIYLVTIGVVAVLAGLGLNALLAATGWSVVARLGGGAEGQINVVEVLAAVILASLIAWNYVRTGLRAPLEELLESSLGLTFLLGKFRTWRHPWRTTAGVLAAVGTLVWLFSGFTAVQPGEAAVVRRFGSVQGEPLGPGAHLRLPYPIERIDTCRVDQIRTLALGFRIGRDGLVREAPTSLELDMITGDENLVDATATVEYSVIDPQAFLYASDDVEQLVRAAAVASVNSTMVGLQIDEVLTTRRGSVQQEVEQRAAELLDSYGIGVELVSFRLLVVHAPPAVHDAFREVASAHEDYSTTVNFAEGLRDSSLATARADATRIRTGAASYAEQEKSRAAGEAHAFRELSGAARSAPRATRTRLHLETVERVLSGRRKVIRPGRGSGDFELWLVPPVETDGKPDSRIEVPVIPQRPGDPESMLIDLDTGRP